MELVIVNKQLVSHLHTYLLVSHLHSKHLFPDNVHLEEQYLSNLTCNGCVYVLLYIELYYRPIALLCFVISHGVCRPADPAADVLLLQRLDHDWLATN